MRITRVIAVTIIAATAGLTSLNAQTLRKSSPPAEFPPASYKGKQYVDSRGCIYIRAGIDGNVTWVPRVSRDRRQVCGYKPTAVAGATARPTQAPKPKLITIEPTAPTTTTTATAAATAAPKPKTQTRTQTRTQTKPSPGPEPTVVSTSKPAAPAAATVRTTTRKPTVRTTTRTTTARPTTTTVTTRPAATVAPKPTTATTTAAPVVAPRRAAPAATTGGGCSNASAFSQQFINKSGVRCGPQTESPITYGSGRKSSSLGATPAAPAAAVPVARVSLNTRVAPRHVYDNRQNTQNVEVPKGFRPVWTDDRLNPHRAERTLRPAITVSRFEPPTGFRAVERNDDRLNPNRGMRTAAGDAQSDAIWQRTLPRTLRPVPTDAQIVTVPRTNKSYTNLAPRPNRLTISTRSGPTAPVEARYVRVAAFETDAAARQAAKSLSGTGLSLNVGTVRRGSGTYKVILAGPFTSQEQASAALTRVQGAGYSGARLTK